MQEWSIRAPNSNSMVRVQNSLKSCSRALIGWSKNKFRDSVKEIRSKTERIKLLQDEKVLVILRRLKSFGLK